MSLPKHFENKFEILHKISEGGMGAVYKVRHQLLDQIQVIKVIRPQHEDDEDLRRRFQREAQTAMQMRHRNIAAMHDFSIGEGGTAYIVMEHIDGRTLYDLLKESGPLALDLVMEVARQSLDALEYLHRRGYVHRDISPDNLMLTRDADGAMLVKLIDLGVAKQVGGGRDLTSTGMFVGKARYSSPEQLNGKEPDQRSDVYSFGVMLYQLLTGAVPIEGTDMSSLVAGHLFRPPIPFADSDPRGRVPEGLRQVVMRTLEKDPDERIASAAELARLLAPYQTEIEATIQTPLESVPVPGPVAAGGGDVRDEISASAEEATVATAGRRRRPAPRRTAEDGAEPPGRGRLLIAAGAVVAVVVAAVLWRSLEREPVVVPEWEQQYHEAVAALEAGEPSGVPGRLRRARQARPDAVAAPEWASPKRSGPYLPNYFLGLAYFLQNNCVEALDAWREAERQGVVQATPYWAELQKSKPVCQEMFESTVLRLEASFERSTEYRELLQGALDNPLFRGFWEGAPELAQEADAAITDFGELHADFEAARDRGALGDVLRLESDAVQIEDKLGVILDLVSKQGG